MEDFKKFVKENKKRALAIAVATAFAVSNPLAMTGCKNKELNQEEEEEQQQGGSSGGYGGSSGGHYSNGRSSGWWFFRGSSTPSSDTNIGSGSSKSSTGKSWSTPPKGSSGYSGVKGGSSSS